MTDRSQNYASMLESSVKKGRKKRKPWQSVEGKPDPSFLRDMGYGQKKKKKGS